MMTQRSGSSAAMARYASRRRRWMSSVSFSKRSATSLPRRACALCRPSSGVDVENQRHIRHHAVHRYFFQPGHEFGIEIAGDALVDTAGIEEAVAQNDRAAGDGRPYHLLDMVGAGGREKDCLHLGTERLGGAREQDMPYRFGSCRAAGLARDDDVMAGLAQCPGESGDLRRLAGALAALEGDEEAAPVRSFRKRAVHGAYLGHSVSG